MNKLMFFKKNISKIVLIILILFNFILVLGLNDLNITKKGIISIIFEIIIIILFYALYKFMIKKKYKIEKIFIIYFIIIGLGYLFFFPVGSLPDEINHFMRGYEISNGNLISKKCKTNNGHSAGCNKITPEIKKAILMSGATYDLNKKVSNVKYKSNTKKIYKEFTNTSLYSFVCYIPQAIGIFTARLLNLPILYWDYMARLFNFALFTLFIYISINIIPYKKNIIMFICLLPITIQSAISISADSLTIASAILLISYTLYLNKNEEKITKKQMIKIFILSTILSLCKIVYLPLCLFPIILSNKKFSNTKNKYIFLIFLFLFVALINLIWLHIASDYLLSIDGGANPSKQIDLIMHKPWIYLVAIYNTTISNFDFYLYTQLGSSLGMLNIIISPIYVKINLLILILLLMFNNEEKIDNGLKIWALLIYLSVVFLIYSSLYVQWTHVGNTIIDGIQGRYFLPILPLLFIFSNNNLFKLNNKKLFNEMLMISILIIENLYVITHLFNYY